MNRNQHDAGRWAICRLKDHPRQITLFGDLPEQEFAALVEHVKKHGLEKPIEILPDGTIIAGHQRVRAAKKLGWEQIDVIVRQDLKEQGDSAIEEYFINDNLVRRQLSPLGRARCIRRLLELAKPCPSQGFDATRRDHLKREISKKLGMCPRNVNRYLLVLETPMVVQLAFDWGELPLIMAGRVALLQQSDQKAISARIAQGETAKTVVDEYSGTAAK